MERYPQPSAWPPWWLMLGLVGVTMSSVAALLSGNWTTSAIGVPGIIVFAILLFRDRRAHREGQRASQ